MTPRQIGTALLLAATGVTLIVVGIATWGTDNHMIGVPFREMTGVGVGCLLLSAWVAVA